MYCPVCGDEYREGITRCPEHDVELVEEPPELEEPASWVDRFNDRLGLRIAFVVFVIAALIYAVSGAAHALLYLMMLVRDWNSAEAAEAAQWVQSAAFPVGITALGALAAATLLRGYLILAGSRGEASASTSRGATFQVRMEGPIPTIVMRFLFVLVVGFALLWAGTGVAISRERVEYTIPRDFTSPGERPGDSYILLSTLHYVAYVGGTASLAIMGASLIVGAYRRARVPESKASVDADEAPPRAGI